MKKIILTVLTLFAFVFSNAQVKTKANHNTTRSNQHSGIMAKEDNRDNDCDGVIDSKGSSLIQLLFVYLCYGFTSNKARFV